jgi:hypothetical protein
MDFGRRRDAATYPVQRKAASEQAKAKVKKSPARGGASIQCRKPLRLQQRHEQQRDDVDDLDRRLRRSLTPFPSPALRERGEGAVREPLRLQQRHQ